LISRKWEGRERGGASKMGKGIIIISKITDGEGIIDG